MNISQTALIIGIFSFIVGLIVVYLSVLLMVRYKQKRQKATFYIIMGNLSWAGAILSASVIYVFAGYNLELGKVFQIIMYTLIFSATIFTYMFARNIFFTEKTKFYIYYILLGILAIIILAVADSSYIEPFPDNNDTPAIILKTEYSIILVIYLIPTIIGITIAAFRSARKMEERIYVVGFRLIGLGQINILLSMVCDTIATLLITDVFGYGLFLILQWTTALMASICLYVGWTMPSWFKKKYGISEAAN